MSQPIKFCPCGSNSQYNDCCGRYLDSGQIAASAENLMRSRYTAYTLLREDYLLSTWHPSTRPIALGLAQETPTKWLGLKIIHHEMHQADHAFVEFMARYKVNGRALRLHEVSRFVYENGRWFYVEGDNGTLIDAG